MIWTYTELHAIDMMRRYGDSFVKAFAVLCILADETNANRLRVAFAEYFAQYSNWN